ncbi:MULTISPECIES: hypothetical protein [unclassified Leisingera]|uniref:hypothetical protein n=1 Tax=unclassified Leisingera TaxID=2614906 RepID=UPI001010F88D|nr:MULTISPECIES: hypothetical protein [unclassified Leisingera]MCF6430577.1 hypothetical protein [Leisingera sp. MMG026]QAX32097.1 hypothetical protein ETW24_22175 [Leisingera sp. NJS204]
MTLNPPLGPCAPFNQALAGLQDSTASGRISAGTLLSDGFTLRADPALQAGGHWRSPAGRLLELDLQIAGQGEWIGLHLTLGQLGLLPFRYAGVACRSAAGSAEVLRPCLRAGLPGGGFSDCFFPRHLLAREEPSDHMDTLHLPSCPHLPLDAEWFELVLFLPTRSCRLELQDLRLFFL